METYFGKHEKLNNVKRPVSGAFFHGEHWYKCPECEDSFEFHDAQFERGFKYVRGNIYQHKCGQLLDMT